MTAREGAAQVLAAEEERIRSFVDFERHRDNCVGQINGMRRALQVLRDAGLLVTPEHDAQVAARALRTEAARLRALAQGHVIGGPQSPYGRAGLDICQQIDQSADRIERQAN